MSRHDPYINKLIFSKYLIRKKIGKGSFGTVYQGINTSNNEKIALKVEKREKNDSGTLENEALRLVFLQGEGVPCVYCYGNNLYHNLLVEELLGKSLEDLFNLYGKPFSLKTVCVLGIEMIKRIQYIHSKYYIHRDIKPDNFMIGRGQNEKKIYIIDFGLAKKYYSVSKAQHIKFITGKHLIGTARYCGRNAHRGYEQGRRDDIESIGYVLMYFLLGVLPWQGLKVRKNEDHFEKIAQKKYSTSFEELTSGQPEEFLLYFKHVEKLEFEDQPNYIYLIGLFQKVIDKYCTDCFYDFDWKKDTCTYISHKNNNISKQLDVSLIVNKNNEASAMDYSNMNEDEENDENDENDEHHKKNKKIKKKEVFMGEDDTPIEEHNNQENNDNYNENKHKMRRVKSTVNLKKNKNKNKNENDNKKLKKKKTKNENNNEDENEISMKNKKTSKENSKINNNENNDNNELKNDENINNSNNKNIINDKKQNSQKSSQNDKNKKIENEDLNIPYSNKDNYNDEYKDIEINNKFNKNKFNYDYNDEYKLQEKKDENNDLDTKDKNNDEQNNNDNLFNDESFELEEGIKTRKRIRSGSLDDKKTKDDNVICRCNIF